MELWIRSQKNEKLRPLLLKVNEIEIGDYDDDMNCIVVNNLYCVGIYNSKERALEILDEIQYLLNNNFCYSEELNRYINCNNAIYEMPEE